MSALPINYHIRSDCNNWRWFRYLNHYKTSDCGNWMKLRYQMQRTNQPFGCQQKSNLCHESFLVLSNLYWKKDTLEHSESFDFWRIFVIATLLISDAKTFINRKISKNNFPECPSLFLDPPFWISELWYSVVQFITSRPEDSSYSMLKCYKNLKFWTHLVEK